MRGRSSLGSTVTQPKRVALLAYLALARPRGYHRRDTLLALFWPELDRTHARNALSQGLWFLRRTLPDGVLLTRGKEELAVDPDRSWSDVVAFEEAIAAGRWADALDLYRGELLAGFHIAHAPAFERWLDMERERLRELAAKAAWSLADEDLRAGRPVDAERTAQRALLLMPTDESPVRAFVEALAAAGDRGAALRFYSRFATLLRDQLDVEPSSESAAVAEALRDAAATGHGMDASVAPEPVRRRAPATPGAVGSATAAEPLVDLTTELPARDLSWRHNGGRRVRGLISTLVLTGAFLVVYSLVRAGPMGTRKLGGTVHPVSSKVAVLPFTVRGSDRLAYLGDGIVELLSADLERPGRLRAVAPQAVLGAVARQQRMLAPDAARAIAERLEANLFVLGGVVEVEGNVRLTASLYDRSRGSGPLATRAVEGDAADVLNLVRRLAESLEQALPVAQTGREPAVRLLWSDPEIDLMGTVSPDGRLVSFVDWTTGDLAVHDVATGRDRRLTHKGTWAESNAFAEFSRFSPDASLLAYAWHGSDGRYRLQVIPVGGGDARTLVTMPRPEGWLQPLDWAPDSRHVLAELVGDGPQRPAALAWVGLASSTVDTILLFPRSMVGSAAVSPDGRWIAYDYPAPGESSNRDLFLIRADGSGKVQLHTDANEQVLAWASDGEGIIFWSDRNGEPAICAQPVAAGRFAGEPTVLRSRTRWVKAMGPVGPALSYAVMSSETQSYVASVDLDAASIIADPEVAAHASAESTSRPTWSPDGHSIAYLVNAYQRVPGSTLLAIRHLGESEFREYSLPIDRALGLHWWPDPAGLLVRGQDDNVFRYYRFDPATGQLKKLPISEDAFRLVVAPDGHTAFHDVHLGLDTTEIVSVDLVTGRVGAVLARGSSSRAWAVFPDGAHLLFTVWDARVGRYQLRVVPTAGGEDILIHELPDARSYADVTLSPDGRYALYVRSDDSTHTEIWRLRLADGDDRRLLAWDGLSSVSIAPDSRHILFMAGGLYGEVWLLEPHTNSAEAP